MPCSGTPDPSAAMTPLSGRVGLCEKGSPKRAFPQEYPQSCSSPCSQMSNSPTLNSRALSAS